MERQSQARIRLLTLALKPREDVTRSPKQGYQWRHKKDLCAPIFFKKKKERNQVVHKTCNFGISKIKIPLPPLLPGQQPHRSLSLVFQTEGLVGAVLPVQHRSRSTLPRPHRYQLRQLRHQEQNRYRAGHDGLSLC